MTPTDPRPDNGIDRRLLAVAGLVLLVALALRLPPFLEARFWMDEMISIGIAQEGVLQSVVATLRLSSHPPSYYTQLALWMVVSDADLWIMANPLLWSLASVALLIWLAGRRYGMATGVAAGALLAVLPSALYAAANVRMYPMIHAVAVFGWWLSERYFAAPARSGRVLAGLALCQLLVGYAHGIGPALSACLGLHGLILAVQRWPGRRRFWIWFAVQAAVGVALVAVVASGFLRGSQHEPAGSVMVLLRSLAQVAFHYVVQLRGGNAWLLPAAVLFAVAAAAALRPALRGTALALVVVPVGAVVLAVLAGAPLPGGRAISVILPFICLAAAGAAVHWYTDGGVNARRLFAAGSAAMLAVALLGAGLHIAYWSKTTNFRAAAADMRAGARPGDFFLVDGNGAVFWGIARELVGPDWGSSLAIQAPANERWQALFDRLPAWLVDDLGLIPKTDRLTFDDHTLAVGMQALPSPAPGTRLWLIAYDHADWPLHDRMAREVGWQPVDQRDYRSLLVMLYEPSS